MLSRYEDTSTHIITGTWGVQENAPNLKTENGLLWDFSPVPVPRKLH